MRAKLLQLCPPLCDPMDYSPPGSSVHGILQARIYQNESATGIYVFPILNRPPSPYHPSELSQCTSPKTKKGLAFGVKAFTAPPLC